MKKNIGILTCGMEPNYGACLQAFATQKVINEHGYNAELINYSFMSEKEYSPLSQKNLRSVLSSILFYKLRKGLHFAFKTFRDKYMDYSGERLTSPEQIKQIMGRYDIILVGSDQVWNPYLGIDLNITLLQFYDEGPLKVSYASSFGVSKLPEEKKYLYQQALSKFNKLSTREVSGNRIIYDLLGKDVPVVADPTMLLTSSQWDEYAEEVHINNKYVLIYDMNHSEEVRNIAGKVAAEKNAMIVALSRIILPGLGIKTLQNISPAHFLYLFKNAEAVVTDSFHGTIFSILYHKEFYSCCPKAGRMIGTRLTNLLELLQLEDRLVNNASNFKVYPVRYEDVDIRLEQFRKASINFLIGALSEL
jgi:hypothetical protein